MSSKYVIAINSKEEFENNVLRKSKEMLVVVDFWASWCGPCVMFGPIFEKVAEELKGKAIFAKVSVENLQDVAQDYDIRSIPAIKFFKEGNVIDESLGLLPKDVLKKLAEKYI